MRAVLRVQLTTPKMRQAEMTMSTMSMGVQFKEAGPSPVKIKQESVKIYDTLI